MSGVKRVMKLLFKVFSGSYFLDAMDVLVCCLLAVIFKYLKNEETLPKFH